MNISRRQFLKTGVLWLSLLSACRRTFAAPGGTKSGAATQAPTELKIKGAVVAPGSPLYNEARLNYNSRFEIKPKSIVYCQSEDDVRQAVKWARANKIPVAVRSGGHSYEAFSLTGDGAVIDVSNLDGITVNAAKKTARVQSGVRLMELYESLWEKRCVVPAGSCATVGVAGLTLGGGFGLLARRFGLTCDNLTGVRMVDAKGNIVEANAGKNSDLFWACRGGGGGNFGIVTEFTFRLQQVGNVTVFRLSWDWQEMPAVIEAWQKWAPFTDDRITSVLTLTSKMAYSLSCIGVFVGGRTEAEKLLRPLYTAVKPTHISYSVVPFIDAARRFSGFKRQPNKRPIKAEPQSTLPTRQPSSASATQSATPTVPPPAPQTVHIHPESHTRFKNTSDYVAKPLDKSAIETIVNFLSQSPIGSSCLQLDGYGGAINRVPADATAFCHRGDTMFCMHYQVSWNHRSDDERSIHWVNGFRKAMQPHVSGFAYVSYCDREVEDWAHAYYGANLTRLVAVKKKYDPDNFFHFAQSIPVEMPPPGVSK